MNMNRDHIQDTVSATIEEYGNSIDIHHEDVVGKKGILKSFGERDELRKSLTFKDNEYDVVITVSKHRSFKQLQNRSEESGFDWSKVNWEGTPRKDKAFESHIFDVLFKHKKSGNTGFAQYAVYQVDADGKKWRLAYIGNPTTLMNGHNSGPVRLRDKPGFFESMALHRVGFKFFFKAIGYTMSEDIASRLRDGLISLQNTQFAIYVPSSDKNRDLSVLKLIYDRIAKDDLDDNGRYLTSGKRMAELLGVKPISSAFTDMTGLMLRGFSGKNNPSFTVNFYDKALSNENKQKKGIPAYLQKVIDSSLRVDITLHRRMIDHLASQTYTIIKKRIEEGVKNRYYDLFIEQMEQRKSSSVLVICLIMHILPKIEKVTFASFLLQRILCEELYLDRILSGVSERLELDPADHKANIFDYYQSWKRLKTPEAIKVFKTESIAAKLITYKQIGALEKVMGISMDIPYLFWSQTAAYDTVYGLTNEQLAKLNFHRERAEAAGNNYEEMATHAIAAMKLLQKGKKTAERERAKLAATFLTPIGIKVREEKA